MGSTNFRVWEPNTGDERQQGEYWRQVAGERRQVAAEHRPPTAAADVLRFYDGFQPG